MYRCYDDLKILVIKYINLSSSYNLYKFFEYNKY